ncbi:MAG: hypothetical protein GKR95_01195 [Gammaproteobacteria bacterium]|nr:hypothetical protein [Gammaproteobacteria bacterium]
MSLEIFQSTWAMEVRQPGKQELSLSEKCSLTAGSGFDGLNIDLDVEDMPPVLEVRDTLTDYGLACSVVAFPANVDELIVALERCGVLDATSLVVNARYFPFSVEQGGEFVENCLATGREFGIPVHFETHRLTLTNDLLYTVQLLECCPDLRLVADLSHYVLGREMPIPVDGFHQELIERILRRSVSIQGRIPSREQIQLPLHFPSNQDWVSQFYEWWEWGMKDWLSRSTISPRSPSEIEDNNRFNFTCELGPSPYAMTDENGVEFSDRWEEGLVLKREVEKTWQRCVIGSLGSES